MLTGLLIAWFTGSAQAVDWPPLDALEFTPTQRGERDAALIIGVSDYPILGDAASIPGAAAAADAWRRLLEEGRGVESDHIRLLLDRRATRGAIHKGGQWVTSKVEPGGILWVVFVGHGWIDGRLLPVNLRPSIFGLGESNSE